jgi:hypothetical protein
MCREEMGGDEERREGVGYALGLMRGERERERGDVVGKWKGR